MLMVRVLDHGRGHVVFAARQIDPPVHDSARTSFLLLFFKKEVLALNFLGFL
jgi:hypothetical protein